VYILLHNFVLCNLSVFIILLLKQYTSLFEKVFVTWNGIVQQSSMHHRKYYKWTTHTSSRTRILQSSVLTSSLFIRSSIRPGVATIMCTAHHSFTVSSSQHHGQQCTPSIHCVFISTSRSTVHTIHSLCLHLNITVNSAHHSFTVSSSQHHGQQCTPFIHCVFISTSRSTVLCLHWSRLHCASYIDKTVCQPSSNTHGNSVIWFLVIPGAIYVPVAIKYRQSWELRSERQYSQKGLKFLE